MSMDTTFRPIDENSHGEFSTSSIDYLGQLPGVNASTGSPTKDSPQSQQLGRNTGRTTSGHIQVRGERAGETWMDFLRSTEHSTSNPARNSKAPQLHPGFHHSHLLSHPSSDLHSTSDIYETNAHRQIPSSNTATPSYDLAGPSNAAEGNLPLREQNLAVLAANHWPLPPYASHPYTTIPAAGQTLNIAKENDKKRRLTDTTPSGREGGGSFADPRAASSSAMSGIRVAPPPVIDLTSHPSAFHRGSPSFAGGRTDGSFDRRHASSDTAPGGGMMIDPPQYSLGAFDQQAFQSPLATDREGQPSEIVLPRWQPDAEVTSCPVCGNHFGFFYRKHHCRKCGRVVCANCSPHRITIPHQFIVQAPSFIDLTSEDVSIEYQQPPPQAHPALSGGAQVRVCNPCVPDPNLSPPPPHQTAGTPHPALRRHSSSDQVLTVPPDDLSRQPPQQHAQRSLSGLPLAAQNWPGGYPYTDIRAQRRMSSFAPGDRFTDGRVIFNNPTSVSDLFPPPRPTMVPASSQNRPLPPPPFGLLHPTSGTHMSSDALIAPRTSSRAHRPRHSTGSGFPGAPTANPRHRSLLDPLPPDPPSALQFRFHPQGLRMPHDSLSRPTELPHPRRQIAEEDECPVCGNELPPKGSDGSELDRERHVEECIASHFSPSSSVRPDIAVAAPPALDPTLPQNFPSGLPSSLPATDVSGAPSRPRAESSTAVPVGDGSPAVPRRRRATGNRMLVYTATEKDCAGSEGDVAECIICFEEFEPGIELGRLECLCKFHRGCIRQWWDTKGVGSCPTHQLHD